MKLSTSSSAVAAAMVVATVVAACGAVAAGANPPAPVIYEISTRPWLYQLSQKYGKNMMLADVPVSEYQDIADHGAQVVWMMGVWHLGPYGLNHDRTDPSLLSGYAQVLPGYTTADIIGSPYAITNYTCNPEIGTDEDLVNLRATLNSLGLKLMLDFVPNHSAVDASWSTTNPEYYVNQPSSGSWPSGEFLNWNGHNIAFGRDPYDGSWTDTLQFNYWNPDTVQLMTQNLMTVASLADMARCDMAMLILNDEIEKTWGDIMSANGYNRPADEFWATAISTVQARYPDFQLMAESYNYGFTPEPEDVTLQGLGFSYTYEKSILDNLEADNLDDLRADVASNVQSFYDKTCHFVENHDEPRAASSLGGDQQAFIGSVITATLPGARLFYFGQYQGFKNKLDVHLRRAVAESVNTTVQTMYYQLLSIVSDPVFHSGQWNNIGTNDSGSEWRLVAWRWANGSDKRLVVVNFSNEQGWGNIVVPDAEGDNGGDNITITELFSNIQYTRSANTMRTTGKSTM